MSEVSVKLGMGLLDLMDPEDHKHIGFCAENSLSAEYTAGVFFLRGGIAMLELVHREAPEVWEKLVAKLEEGQ